MRQKPNPEDIAEVYIDESGQNKHRYLVLGGILIKKLSLPELNNAVANARLPELPQKEVKWTKVSKGKLAAYKRIVDLLFQKSDYMHFHSLVIDTTQLDHARFNAGSREIGFNKEIYQLAMKFARAYPAYMFHLYPDYRETTQKPEDLRLILNRGCAKKGDKRDWPFRRCQFRDSKKTPLLQMADLIIGGIAYRLNGHDKASNASPAKVELSAHILACAGIKDVHKSTTIYGTFTIWHRQLQPKRVS